MKSGDIQAHFRVALALISISAAFSHINRTGYFAYHQFNSLALELVIYSLAHHLCKM